ncbi:hypothetical protein, partial [Microbacterium sp. GbtcB4]|uniref:hypothetical protein n=1 Tax=Microbacterium sp. GbtcB4 TaxID=2824749 RepID=UPI001C3095B8
MSVPISTQENKLKSITAVAISDTTKHMSSMLSMSVMFFKKKRIICKMPSVYSVKDVMLRQNR